LQPVLTATDPPVLQLSATDLIHANAGSNGFTVNTEPSHLYFTVNGTIGNNTKYMFPGTQDFGQVTTTASGIPFAQRCIVMEGILRSSNALTGAETATVNVYKNTTVTPIMTMTINSTNRQDRVRNKCATFDGAGADILIVELVTSGGIGNNPLFVGLGTY
jgi:hypothetical protein